MVKMKEMIEKVNNKWVRLVALVAVVLNGSLKMFGYDILPFDNEQIVAGISVAGVVVVGSWSFWKDNPFTLSAKHANNYMHAMKKKIKEQQREFKKLDDDDNSMKG